MQKFDDVVKTLLSHPSTWLITGVAGFIGSNLLENLLSLDQMVVGLDNFSTGHRRNLAEVESLVSEQQWRRFTFIEGDIRDYDTCKNAIKNVDHVLHQAALGSVPRSIADPILTNGVNVTGQLNMLLAAKEEGVKSFVYAASSSTYGDHPGLPKIEDTIGNPLSPYAVTKYVNELYSQVFFKVYGFKSVGLRYFNVFGPRQDPEGPYAAVIPKWISSMIAGDEVHIYGDGETSRDFCFVKNAINANILAATSKVPTSDVYNVALGERTSLRNLFLLLRNELKNNGIQYRKNPFYKEFRKGDVRHSQAEISKVKKYLAYEPEIKLEKGIKISVPWYIQNERDTL